MMTREEAFKRILDAYGIVDEKQTLQAFELLARGADPQRVADAIESMRHGFDALHEIDCDLERGSYEQEYEEQFGCKPELGRRFGSGRY